MKILAWEVRESDFPQLSGLQLEAEVSETRASEIILTFRLLLRGSYVIEAHGPEGIDHYHYDADTGIGGGCFIPHEEE